MGSDFEISRRESRKRRRLSERRRIFGRFGTSEYRLLSGSSQMSSDYSPDRLNNVSGTDNPIAYNGKQRSDSPISVIGYDNQKISMKIQFHITVAPDNEPLILDTDTMIQGHQFAASQTQGATIKPEVNNAHNNQSSTKMSSIGEQINEKIKLSRQNTSSQKRRQQLMAMHNNQSSTRASLTSGTDSTDPGTPLSQEDDLDLDKIIQSEDNLLMKNQPLGLTPPVGREAGARSSTITGGMADEATMRFLQQSTGKQRRSTATGTGNSVSDEQEAQIGHYNSAMNLSLASQQALTRKQLDRERIYFKRDGQRFGHEFTLKLAVDRTYRCLLKIRPLIPIQSISVQGHQVLFVDCSQQNRSSISANSASASRCPIPGEARASLPTGIKSNFNDETFIHKNKHSHQSKQKNQDQQQNHQTLHTNNMKYHRLHHAQTTGSLYEAPIDHSLQSSKLLISSQMDLIGHRSSCLYRQQQNQMRRNFAASYCSSSNSHLGNQLIYMFDWSAGRFEVNKNKNRTQVQTVLKFKNGQIMSLPLQVKFYQSDCKQHLEWGSQLHFIDYDCQINNMGQISVDRIQYY